MLAHPQKVRRSINNQEKNDRDNSQPENSNSPVTIQAKLAINDPNDIHEKEADEMADKVMRMPVPEPINFSASKNSINRKCSECEKEEKELQRKESNSEHTSVVPSVVNDVLSSSNGRSLDPATRLFMEPRFNYDFSNVNIHNDDAASKSADAINALAYTSGNNIVFNSGQYDTGSDAGKKLLAHELTHVVQQENSHQQIQRKPTLTKKDFDDIANKVHKAIAGLGTDEEAVYAALQRLERDPDAIAELKNVYRDKFKDSLESDIRGDFSDEELQYALELIGITPEVKEELIISVPSSELDFEAAATKLYKAMDIWGTNEEAIFGVLLAMENVPERIAKLRAAYSKKYPKGVHGGDLEYDIRDEMSSTELDYALLLLNEIPSGNSAILSWIRSLINNRVKKETAKQVMNSLDQLSPDRLRVIIFDIKKAGELDKFRTNLVSVVASDFTRLVNSIASIETEFNSPGDRSTAATADQKTRITGILNQGMNINPVTGDVADFIDVVDSRSYETDVKDTLDKEVAARTAESVARLALPKFDWPRYEEIANEAKKRVDNLYERYASGSALTSAAGPDRNLFDLSERTFSDAILIQFADALVTAQRYRDPIYPGRRIAEVHNADLRRDPEKTTHNATITNWVTDPGNKAKLEVILKAWPGAHVGDDTGNGTILLQRWKTGDEDKNRLHFWRTFQTAIHEYLHKITHHDYSTKAALLGEIKRKIYTEGGTAYFDQRVWKTIYPEEIRSNRDLRKKVEGAEFDYNSSLIPTRNAYEEQAGKFTQIVEVVGEENAVAAYFQGKTDRIGL
jgi:hypothetical protein